MWRKGIFSKQQYYNILSSDRSRYRIALTVLKELENSYAPEDESLLQQISAQLIVGKKKIYRTTSAKRFVLLDQKVVREIKHRFPQNRRIRVHDVGVSNGITSVELFHELQGYKKLVFQSSDFYNRLLSLKFKGSPWTLILDYYGNPIQYIGRGFVLSLKEGESKKLPVNFLMKKWLDKFILKKNIDFFNAHKSVGNLSNYQEVEFHEISLLHPVFHHTQKKYFNFSFKNHDIFRVEFSPFEVVRAMNILNPGYFSYDKIKKAIQALLTNLTEGGLFITGRNIDEEDSRVRASIYKRKNSKLILLYDINEGSEIHPIISQLEIKSTSLCDRA